MTEEELGLVSGGTYNRWAILEAGWGDYHSVFNIPGTIFGLFVF